MTKVFCDKCGKELKVSYKLKYKIYINDIVKKRNNTNRDSNGHAFCQYTTIKEFCVNCYERIMVKAIEEFYNE